ncbi:MAG: hypothetical protein ACRC5A_12770 [Enterobacteriaceae bacterium]
MKTYILILFLLISAVSCAAKKIEQKTTDTATVNVSSNKIAHETDLSQFTGKDLNIRISELYLDPIDSVRIKTVKREIFIRLKDSSATVLSDSSITINSDSSAYKELIQEDLNKQTQIGPSLPDLMLAILILAVFIVGLFMLLMWVLRKNGNENI